MEPKGQGRGIIMEVTHILPLGPFYYICCSWGVYEKHFIWSKENASAFRITCLYRLWNLFLKMTLFSIDYDQLACPISYTQKCHLANICTTLAVFKMRIKMQLCKGVTWRLKLLVVKWMKFSRVMLNFLCLLWKGIITSWITLHTDKMDTQEEWGSGPSSKVDEWWDQCPALQLWQNWYQKKGFVLSFQTAPIYLISHTKGQTNNCQRRPCLRVLRKNTYCDW